MTTQSSSYRWLTSFLIVTMFLSASLVSSNALAQDSTSLDPTPTNELPEPTPLPTPEGSSELFGLQSSVASTTSSSGCVGDECIFYVSGSTDDAGPNPVFGTCPYATSFSEIYFGKCPSGQGITSGFRFPNVTLSPGTSIAEAYLEFTVDGPYTLSMMVAFYGQAAGNALPFSSSSRPENRTLTQASALWTIPPSDRWELNQTRRSPDLTAIVQEIINHPDWISGNALAIITQNASPGLGNGQHRRVIGIDRPPSTYSGFVPRLVVKLATAREPVILLPGGSGTRLVVSQDFTLSPAIPDGHGGTFDNDGDPYEAGDEVWLNIPEILPYGDDDYFDVLRLEPDGVTPLRPEIEAGDILTDVYGVQDIYGNLLSDLEDAGYRLGVDLFVFPYDWRMNISSNAALLDAVVQNALEQANGIEDESQWTITRVNLVAHSMGGSIAREYVSDAGRAARVHRIIAIGTPQLGFPQMTKNVLFGDPLICPIPYSLQFICPINPAEVKDILQNMTGAFQQLPSRTYWEFYDGSTGKPVAFHEGRDFDGDGRALGALTYDQTKAMLFNLDRDPYLDWDGLGHDINQTVFNTAESFHDALDLSWDSGIPVPEVDLIVGTGLCTLGQIQPTYRISFTLPFIGPIQIGPIVRLHRVNGDDTVPLFSASLYDPDTGIDHRGGANTYYVEGQYSSHATLLSQSPVRELVVNLLTGSKDLPDGISQDPFDASSCSGTDISVESPVELHVTDSAGNHTGLAMLPGIDGPIIEQSIPGSQYDDVEETKSVFLPDEGVYTITLKATGSGNFNLIIRSYADNSVDQTILYLRAPLTLTTTGEVVYGTSATEPPVLRLDHDGDGAFDEEVMATSILGPMEGQDVQAPMVEILNPADGRVYAGATPLTWQVSDNSSGVLNEWGIVDNDAPSRFEVANNAIVAMPAGQHTLTVFAEDRAGNAAMREVTFTIYSFEWLPPLSIADPYVAQAGSTIPVKFKVHDLAGGTVQDASVELRLLDASGNTVAGPFFSASNPNQGVKIQGDGQYHHNLRTTGLASGTYTLQVTFDSAQMGGLVTRTILLQP